MHVKQDVDTGDSFGPGNLPRLDDPRHGYPTGAPSSSAISRY